MKSKGIWLATLAAVCLVGLSPVFAAPVISRGVDTFTTVANGSTYYDFKQTPIPAGFFCKRSAAFTGRISLRGVPLATEVPGELHGADTVLERLDDATFDETGVATTRLRFKALSLAGIKPVHTACGDFHVYVTLADHQRETEMKIQRTSEQGGTFIAPLAVDARMTFIPVRQPKGAAVRNLELTGTFTFPAQPLPWMHQAGPQTKRLASARIDTNGDQRPDTVVSGTSNFAPGWSPEAMLKVVGGGGQHLCEPQECHTDEATQKVHCTGPVYVCASCSCP